MANCEALLPIFFRWETGCRQNVGESIEAYFNRALAYNRKVTGGTFTLSGDAGGFTVVGITHTTYEAYLKAKGAYKSEADAHMKMIAMDYTTWKDVFKTLYWDKWKADTIKNQSIANIVVDWAWGSGAKTSIIQMQKLLGGLVVDGICGAKTIAKINASDPKVLFEKIKKARENFFDAIIKARPTNAKFRKGWMNRLNSYVYHE